MGQLLADGDEPPIRANRPPPFRCFNSSPEIIRLVVLMYVRFPPQRRELNTIYRRFRRWSEAGVWEIVAVTLAEIMADTGHYSIDRTTVRAHVSAAGGKGAHRRVLGRSRGGFTSKLIAWLTPSDDRSPST